MKLFDHIKAFARGADIIRDWLGHDGVVVSREEAQCRADICTGCEKNVNGFALTETAAKAIREQIELKNHVQLRVNGEKKLHHCAVCGCVLRLLVWCPDSYLHKYETKEENARYPTYCWKRKP